MIFLLSCIHPLEVRLSWEKTSTHSIFFSILNTHSQHFELSIVLFSGCHCYCWKIRCLFTWFSIESNLCLTSVCFWGLLFIIVLLFYYESIVWFCFYLFCFVFLGLPKCKNQCLSGFWKKSLQILSSFFSI